MALDKPTWPLEIASRILSPQTIAEVRRDPQFTNSGYLILDRWALNQPEDLRRLEEKAGSFLVTLKLYAQQELESRTLCSEAGFEAKDRGLSDWEILEMFGVDTRLVP